jgi:hypothetical protein
MNVINMPQLKIFQVNDESFYFMTLEIKPQLEISGEKVLDFVLLNKQKEIRKYSLFVIVFQQIT